MHLIYLGMKVIFQPTSDDDQKFQSPPWDWITDMKINLTRNKVYDVLHERTVKSTWSSISSNPREILEYQLVDDKGQLDWFRSYHFVDIDVIRNEKINEILK